MDRCKRNDDGRSQNGKEGLHRTADELRGGDGTVSLRREGYLSGNYAAGYGWKNSDLDKKHIQSCLPGYDH